MPNYETLDGFKKKLKSGHYSNVTGARRAVGKMRTWEDPEKDAARKAIDRHFGDAAKPAPRKAAAPKKAAAAPAGKKFDRKKRPAKKATPKKAAAKPAVKAAAPAKKAAPKKAAAKKAAPKKAAAKGKGKSRSRASAKKATAPSVDPVQERLETYGNAVVLYERAALTLQKCQSDTVNVSEGLGKVAASVTLLIQGMDKEIVQPLTEKEQKGASLFNTATPRAPEALPAPQAVTNGAAPVAPAVVPPQT